MRPASGGLAVRAVGAEAVTVDGLNSQSADVACEEETSYPVLLQSLDGSAVSIRHRDPLVTAALVSDDGGRVVHGRIRFGSQAGRCQLTLVADGRPEADLDLAVLPTKLTEADVRTMREDVEAAAAGLAVTALRPTTLAGAGADREGSPPVWLAALRQSADDLVRALREIDRRPATDTVREVATLRADQVRHPSAETWRHVARTGLTGTVPARPARTTVDTPAHRWLAHRLGRVVERLAALARDEGSRAPSLRRAAVRAEVEALAGRLREVRALPVLSSGGRAPTVPPLALRRRAGYAAAYDALLRLDQGLALRHGDLDVATHDLAVLYETWTALALIDGVAEVLGVAAPCLGVDVRGTDVRLRRGRRGVVRLADGARTVEVAYNPRFPAPPALLVQRPDFVVTVRERGRPARRLVLDAKYRRDDSPAYRRRHGVAGPPEDALGTLHRYRDAIVGPDRQPVVDRAVALFPGDDDATFRASRLWTSIDTLGVGAVPLRPGHGDALRDLLAAFVSGASGA